MLGRFSLKTRFLGMTYVLLFGLCGTVGLLILQYRANLTTSKALLGASRVAHEVSNLIHEMQKERGKSALYLVPR